MAFGPKRDEVTGVEKTTSELNDLYSPPNFILGDQIR